jgi:hypothetical protein
MRTTTPIRTLLLTGSRLEPGRIRCTPAICQRRELAKQKPSITFRGAPSLLTLWSRTRSNFQEARLNA